MTGTGGRWIEAGCVLAGLGVVAGAFGAHALRGNLPPADLVTFETAVRYQMYHALALLAVGVLFRRSGGRLLALAGWSFLAGTIVFSGTLYFLVLTGPRWLGAITPLGGLSLVGGWVFFLIAAWRRR